MKDYEPILTVAWWNNTRWTKGDMKTAGRRSKMTPKDAVKEARELILKKRVTVRVGFTSMNDPLDKVDIHPGDSVLEKINHLLTKHHFETVKEDQKT